MEEKAFMFCAKGVCMNYAMEGTTACLHCATAAEIAQHKKHVAEKAAQQ